MILPFLCLISAGTAADDLPPSVKSGTAFTYRGWVNSILISGKELHSVIVPQIGGRIMWFGTASRNLIYEEPGSDGKTLEKEKNWFMLGGYQLDIGPESAGFPSHFPLWLGAYSAIVSNSENPEIVLGSPEDPSIPLKLSKQISFLPDGSLLVRQSAMNRSERSMEFCLWDRTLCVPNGYLVLPLKARSIFPYGWGVISGKEIKSESPSLPGARRIGSHLVVKTGAGSGKIGADSDAGWIAYLVDGMLFVKKYPYYENSKYGDYGCSVELYFNEKLTELEPLSRNFNLAPGGKASFDETWTLHKLAKEPSSHEEAVEECAKLGLIPSGK